MYSGVIIKYNDKCLLCKRSEKYTHPNEWFIPAGQIEDGETPRETAIRELYEETNLQFTEEDLNFVGTIPTKDDEGGLSNDFIYLFVSEVNHPLFPDLENAMDGKEHTKCGYFDFEGIKKLGLDSNLLKVLKKYFDTN